MKSSSLLAAMIGVGVLSLGAIGCAVDASSPAPSDGLGSARSASFGQQGALVVAHVERLPGGMRVSTPKLRLTHLIKVHALLPNGAETDAADSVTVESLAVDATAIASTTYIKAPEGYAISRTAGGAVVDPADLLAAADAAGEAGNTDLAGMAEALSEHAGQPVEIDADAPQAVIDGTPLFVSADTSGDTTAQSASFCGQAQANSRGDRNNDWVSYSYQYSWKVAFWGSNKYNRGAREVGPKTAPDACFGRCGKGCDWKWAGTKYTSACTNHDQCAGDYGLFNWRCDLIFGAAIWDVATAPSCF